MSSSLCVNANTYGDSSWTYKRYPVGPEDSVIIQYIGCSNNTSPNTTTYEGGYVYVTNQHFVSISPNSSEATVFTQSNGVITQLTWTPKKYNYAFVMDTLSTLTNRIRALSTQSDTDILYYGEPVSLGVFTGISGSNPSPSDISKGVNNGYATVAITPSSNITSVGSTNFIRALNNTMPSASTLFVGIFVLLPVSSNVCGLNNTCIHALSSTLSKNMSEYDYSNPFTQFVPSASCNTTSCVTTPLPANTIFTSVTTPFAHPGSENSSHIHMTNVFTSMPGSTSSLVSSVGMYSQTKSVSVSDGDNQNTVVMSRQQTPQLMTANGKTIPAQDYIAGSASVNGYGAYSTLSVPPFMDEGDKGFDYFYVNSSNGSSKEINTRVWTTMYDTTSSPPSGTSPFVTRSVLGILAGNIPGSSNLSGLITSTPQNPVVTEPIMHVGC